MSQTGYIIVTILILVGLAVFALFGFLYLWKDHKKGNKKACAGCQELDCPLARKLAEKEDE